MDIKKSVILTFRILEKFWGNITKEQFDTIVAEIGLTNKDLDAMGTILKSMIIMTSGSVETVRDPDSFDPLKTSSWSDITRTGLVNLFTFLRLDITEQISKQDYKTANSLLKKMGSSNIEMSDIKAKIGPNGFNTMKPESLQIGKTLWRGLKKLLGFDNKYDKQVTTLVKKKIQFEQSLRITNFFWKVSESVGVLDSELVVLAVALAVSSFLYQSKSTPLLASCLNSFSASKNVTFI